MKRLAFAGLLVLVSPSAWADCHLPLTTTLPSTTAVDTAPKMQVPSCLGPLQAFAEKAHTGTGAAAAMAGLWVDDSQATLQDPLGAVYRGRETIRKAFEGTVFTSLLAGAYHVVPGSITHGHLKTDGYE